MGQNASRQRSSDLQPQTLQSAPSSDGITQDDELGASSAGSASAPVPSSSSPSKTSRRSSMRQGLRTLITPSKSTPSIRSRVDSTVSQGTESSRSGRRWRASRRWSKAPEDATGGVVGQPQQDGVVSPVLENPEVEGPIASSSAKGKGKEDATETDVNPAVDLLSVPIGASGSNTPTPSIIIQPPAEETIDNKSNEPTTTSNIGTWMGGSGSLAQDLGITADVEEEEVQERIVISPEDFAVVPEADAEVPNLIPPPSIPADPLPPFTTESPAPTASPENPLRQFPPPGTLVVVQGVVHTTDVQHTIVAPRPASTPATAVSRSSTPMRGERERPRSRLSSFIPISRPGGRHSRPSSTIIGDNSSGNNLSVPASPALDNSESSEPISNSDSNTTDDSRDQSNPNLSGSDTQTSVSGDAARDREAARPTIGSNHLSPSSIEVLGTLLSVAAAATAASLLTGSSDPIFSAVPGTAGLAPSSTTSPISPISPSLPTLPRYRPTSPTPTAGLSGLGSSLSGLGLGGNAEPPPILGSRERMRHAWGSLRDRLARRASTGVIPPFPSFNSPPGPPHSPLHRIPDLHGDTARPRMRLDGTPMDAREVMLAEMARAFNLGLGISDDEEPTPESINNPGPTPDGDTEGREAEAGPPPTSPQSPSQGQGPNGTNLPAEGSFERFLVDLQADLRMALGSGAILDDEILGDNGNGNQPPENSAAEDLNSTPVSGEERNVDHQYPAANPDEESDSNIGAETNGDMSANSESPRAQSEGQAQTSNSSSQSPPSPQTNHNGPGGGINWWRSYRFPPITTPHGQGQPTTNMTSAPIPTSISSSQPSEPESSTSAFTASPTSAQPPIGTSATTATHPIPPPTAETGPNNTVVPVIVVGLQSVNMNRRRDHTPAFGEHEDVFGTDHNHFNPDSPILGDDDMNFDGLSSDGDASGRPDTPRGRTWHSRAANAFRNLRPGRRGARAREAGDGPGSRTFLIYVIGGYYPPDHSLITGANTLDSFEALWELAELLGQVKPQTVSKEEIDKSGLEIISPATLEQYETEGKVASNCMERCLICLDDYEPEDPLRLLSCRHAFHKICVDQWLQTGKNNCPACRSKGVSIDDNSESVSPSPV